MTLVALMDFDPEDPDSKAQWDLNHSADHQEIRQAIQAQSGINLTDQVLYPVNWRDWDAWALRHQSTHNDMNSTLNLNGTDLTSVDFTDPRARAEWNFSHFREHKAAREFLGI